MSLLLLAISLTPSGAGVIQNGLKLRGAPAADPIDFSPFDPARVYGIDFFFYLGMVLEWHTPRIDEALR